MRTIQCEQGTPEWLAARAGRFTASRMNDVCAKIAKGEAATRRNYKVEIVVERLTGLPTPQGYVSPAMAWGTENEPFARAAYELKNDVMVEQVGFVLHPVMDFAGASPDGLVGNDGMVEIKCPNTATHLQYILDGVPPSDYRNQMTWEMVCSGREWCDFVSYDPRVPEHLQLFVCRYQFNRDRALELETEVRTIDIEVQKILERLPQPEAVAV